MGVGRGTPSQGWVGGVPHPRSGCGGTQSQIWVGGDAIPGLGGGYPVPGLGGVPHPRSGWGVPHSADWMGYPPQSKTGWGTLPISKASTCYVACGVPLVFMQEDSLVKYRSDRVNSNTVNSNFHLIQTFTKISASFLSFQC